MSRACVLYISNKLHQCYRRVEYTLNAFGAHFRHASVRYIRVPILGNIASVTCPKRVCDAHLTFAVCTYSASVT